LNTNYFYGLTKVSGFSETYREPLDEGLRIALIEAARTGSIPVASPIGYSISL
jgi:hypothetical protein